MGSFAPPTNTSPLFDLPEQIPFMIPSKAVSLLKVTLPKMPEEELNHLLNKGLAPFELIQGNNSLNRKQRQQQQDIEQARIVFMGLDKSSSKSGSPQLWKRLFEIEEGFPGKLKQAKKIPGVQPW